MWLVKKLTPDFKTIADFRKDIKRYARDLPFYVRVLTFLGEK